jgi:hypothetical protein
MFVFPSVFLFINFIIILLLLLFFFVALGAPGTASSSVILDEDPALIKEWAFLVQTVQTSPLDKVITRNKRKKKEKTN